MARSEFDVSQEVEYIRRVQKGDGETFGLLVEKYQQRIFSILFHLVRRRDEVEDLAQEVFFKAFRAIRSYNFQSSFATWLSRIAVNHCYDYLRKVRASHLSYYSEMTEESAHELERKAESPPPQGLDHGEKLALRDFVGRLLERAPEDDRLILTLKELEDYSVEEIADLLKLKTSTVKVRLHRARKRMLEDLERWRQEGK
ncbi:MAG: sigma-70 family RNA polymerase sigma factor [Terriglobia bacterium]|jgi:RNA polymerase sigma-70 factor, ECF subfamily